MTRLSGFADSLAEKDYESVNIAVGLRPSGTIHLGNMSTLALSGLLARKVGPHISTVVLTVCDYDLPDISEWPAKERGYVKYFNLLPDKQGKYKSLLERTNECLGDFVNGLETKLGVGFEIQNLSEVQRHAGFRAGLKRLLSHPEFISYLFPNNSDIAKGFVPIHPLCKSCGTSNFKPASHLAGVLTSSCANPTCSEFQKTYEMDICDVSRDIAVHFLMDPLRDACVPPQAHAHVFGGDYRDPHFGSGVTKIEKIEKMLSVVKEKGTLSPQVIVGPKFYARDGSKMSKTKNNGILLENIRETLGKGYLGRIIHLTQTLAEHGYAHVDFNTWDGILFGGKPH